MVEFEPGSSHAAIAPMSNPTSKAFDYSAELYMGIDLALMVSKAFHLGAGESKDISLPVTMPSATGTYPVYIGVFFAGENIALYQAEDVVIKALVEEEFNIALQQILDGTKPPFYWDVFPAFGEKYPGRIVDMIEAVASANLPLAMTMTFYYMPIEAFASVATPDDVKRVYVDLRYQYYQRYSTKPEVVPNYLATLQQLRAFNDFAEGNVHELAMDLLMGYPYRDMPGYQVPYVGITDWATFEAYIEIPASPAMLDSLNRFKALGGSFQDWVKWLMSRGTAEVIYLSLVDMPVVFAAYGISLPDLVLTFRG